MRKRFGCCDDLRSRTTNRERSVETFGTPSQNSTVFFLTWPTRTWFLTRMKLLSPLTLILPAFANRKSTKLLLIPSTESIRSLSLQWSGLRPRGRTSSWSKGSSSTVFSQRKNPRQPSRKCWTSSLSPATFTCTLLPQPASTNEVTPSLMHSRTLTASYYLTPKLVEVCTFLLLSAPALNSTVDSADFGRPHVNGSAERRLRLASSSPNVKALFDNSPATYSYSIDDDDDSAYMTPQSDYWHPLPPPIVRFGHSFSFSAAANHQFKGIWHPWPREAPGRRD